MYNTETAILKAESDNGKPSCDFTYEAEHLYITQKGSWFMHVQTYNKETIIAMDDEEAFEWLCEHDEIEIIDKYFSNKVKEA